MKKLLILLSSMMLALSLLTGCTEELVPGQVIQSETYELDKNDISEQALAKAEETVEKNGVYTTPALVAAYIHTFNKLPSNYITKKEAVKLGWDSKEGNLDEAAPGKSIGGDNFGNYEKRLPQGKYKECDVNYEGGHRNSERIIYDTDGDIYYTSDHYNTFTQLY